MIQKYLCIMSLWFIKQLKKKATHDYMGIRNTEDCPPDYYYLFVEGKGYCSSGVSFNMNTPSGRFRSPSYSQSLLNYESVESTDT